MVAARRSQLTGEDVRADQRDAAVGAVFQALIGGLAAQWLVAPDGVPTGQQFRAAVRAIAAAVA